MKVIVDTCVWSLALRRNNPDEEIMANLSNLIEESRLVMIGPIRQEVLSGVKSKKQFSRLAECLNPFDDLDITTNDYVLAAELYNACRSKGINGGHVDFLICAIGISNGHSIYTIDPDFAHYAKHVPAELYK